MLTNANAQDMQHAGYSSLLSTHADRQGVDISFTVCFLFLFVCTVTDFSGEDKARGVTFFTEVHRRPGKEISHFGELCSISSSRSDESARARGTPGHAHPDVNISVCADVKFTLEMRRSWNIGRRVDVGSACVDTQPFPKTDVLVCIYMQYSCFCSYTRYDSSICFVFRTSYSSVPSPITSSSSDSPLCTSITPLFYSRLKTYLFHKSYPP